MTNRDITIRAVAEGRNSQNTRVRDVMSSEVIYDFDDQNVEDAAEMTEESQIGRVPVLDHDKGLGGNISIGDLVVRVQQIDLAGRTLTAVAAHG